MAETVLVTGAAGFLGGHLAVELALSGVRVYALARGQGHLSASARFDALRDYFQPPAEARPRGIWPPPGLTVIEGDVELPWLGLGHRPARRLFEEIDQVVHCAARVDFSPSHREALLATNVRALESFLPLLRSNVRSHLRSEGPVFNLVSTAYVCGVHAGVARDVPALEEPVPKDRAFRNPYEESKALAERWVLEELATRGAGWRILRPSILVGETISGRTRSFNALYTLLELLDALRTTGAGNPPERLRVQCPPDQALNLVPVDWVTTAMRVLLGDPRTQGSIFHLTQPRPMTHRDLGEVLTRLFPPLRLETASAEDFERHPATRKETLLARGLRTYQRYLDRHPRFDDRRARRVLDAAGLACPPVHERWLSRLLDYARAARWGRNLPTQQTELPAERRTEDLVGDTVGDLRSFFDVYLPGFRGRPLLPGTRQVDAVFEVRLTDVSGFRRTVEIRDGELQRVDASPRGEPECRYEMSSDVLREILAARLDPREAFFARRTEIRGDMEAGLRVASLMVDFFRWNPFEQSTENEEALGSLARVGAR